MRKILIVTAAIAVFAVSCGKKGISEEEAQAKVLEIAKGSMDVLQPAMMGKVIKMTEAEGAVKAVDFCSENVGNIGKELKGQLTEKFTASHQIKSFAMGRTSHKLRNPKNAPAPEVKAVIDEWLAAEAKGEKAAPKAVKAEGGGYYGILPIRIPTATCLKCHGSEAERDAEAYEIIKTKYPEDQAVDFKEGDLRGAFWVKTEF